jgi:hypothetical protein
MASLPRTVKLLNCLRCGDIFRLYRHERFCKCKASKGKYVGQWSVEYTGPARVLGMGALDYQEAPNDATFSLSKLKSYKWYVIPEGSGEVFPGEGSGGET